MPCAELTMHFKVFFLYFVRDASHLYADQVHYILQPSVCYQPQFCSPLTSKSRTRCLFTAAWINTTLKPPAPTRFALGPAGPQTQCKLLLCPPCPSRRALMQDWGLLKHPLLNHLTEDWMLTEDFIFLIHKLSSVFCIYFPHPRSKHPDTRIYKSDYERRLWKLSPPIPPDHINSHLSSAASSITSDGKDPVFKL